MKFNIIKAFSRVFVNRHTEKEISEYNKFKARKQLKQDIKKNKKNKTFTPSRVLYARNKAKYDKESIRKNKERNQFIDDLFD